MLHAPAEVRHTGTEMLCAGTEMLQAADGCEVQQTANASDVQQTANASAVLQTRPRPLLCPGAEMLQFLRLVQEETSHQRLVQASLSSKKLLRQS